MVISCSDWRTHMALARVVPGTLHLRSTRQRVATSYRGREFGPTHSYSHLSTLERDSNTPGSVKKKSSTSSWVVHLPFFSSVTAATKSEKKTASKRGAAVAQQAVAAAQTPSHSNHASPASRRRQLAQAQCEPVVIEPSSGYYYLGISPLFIRTCF
ncbi:hypothetical protein H4582DRAFT_1041421 [Lactarius indigo]|nr:hypothetical protein H4582DRAFT_1041421 [Lactarius indigo]